MLQAQMQQAGAPERPGDHHVGQRLLAGVRDRTNADRLRTDQHVHPRAVGEVGRRDGAEGAAGGAVLHHRLHLVHLAEEAHHEGLRRVAVELVGGADLHDASVAHERDAVGHEHGLFRVVR
ncbi:MAG: hypothetical protein U5R48_18815 [Gammaproteobacteria bacterium]|nr:hypothetical protein [Gammaproteobacteria bacterium]